MKLVPAYRQPCFLPTPPTPDGNIDCDLAAPEPATAASTPPTSCADFASLAGYQCVINAVHVMLMIYS